MHSSPTRCRGWPTPILESAETNLEKFNEPKNPCRIPRYGWPTCIWERSAKPNDAEKNGDDASASGAMLGQIDSETCRVRSQTFQAKPTHPALQIMWTILKFQGRTIQRRIGPLDDLISLQVESLRMCGPPGQLRLEYALPLPLVTKSIVFKVSHQHEDLLEVTVSKIINIL